MLKNEFYLGFTKYKDELIPGRHVALIEQSLFDQCQAIRAKRRRNRRALSPTRRVYLFSGLAYCSECGLTLRCQSSRSKGKIRYYRHTAAVRGYDCPVPGKMIRASKLEQQWAEIISRIELPDDWRDQIAALAGNADERQAILQERKETEAKLRRLSHLYRDLLIDEREYRDTRDRLQRRLAALVMPGDPKIIDAGLYLEKLSSLWDAATLKEKQDITRVMTATITVDVMEQQIIAIEPVSAFRLILEEICQDLGVTLT